MSGHGTIDCRTANGEAIVKSLARAIGLFVTLAALFASPAGAAEKLKITVIGGSGMIGQRIVHEALERGHTVVAVARDPSKVTETHARLTMAKGDVLDSDGLASVAAGQDVLISAVGVGRETNPDSAFYLQAADSLITALRGLGDTAPRLIVVGGVGSLTDSTGKLILERVPAARKPEHAGQKAALDFYRTVEDVKWTYVSPPGSIAPGERTGSYRVGDEQVLVNDKGESSISMEDYAVALIDEAENPKHTGRRFTVGY